MRAYWPTAKEKKKNLRYTASKMRQWYLLNMNRPSWPTKMLENLYIITIKHF